MNRAFRSLGLRLPPLGCRTLSLLDDSRVEECLEVLTELHFLRSCWLM
jgi:hypothetical protein